MTLWVTIPSGTRRQYLQQIIDTCGVPLSRIVLVNTADNAPTDGVHNMWSDELNIYKWWNMGIDTAQAGGASHVAVLNDDVQLIGDPLNRIYDLMGNATIGQPRMETICGYCFVINVDHGLRADESYTWWYGDNDLYERAEKLHGVEKIDCDVRHLHGNEQTTQQAGLVAISQIDKKLWDSRH